MVRLGTLLLALAVPWALLIVGAPAGAASSPMGVPPVMQPWLVEQLALAKPADRVTVLVHAADARASRSAALRAGLTPAGELRRIGVTVASGTPAQVQRVTRQSGVTYVEGDQPLEYFLESSHDATRGEQAMAMVERSGLPLDGTGVSVAVIDTGVDPTHPFFRGPDGASVVVANLKHTCGPLTTNSVDCFVDVGPLVDTDTASAGGHGTHVNGIVAGQPATLGDGTVIRGAAPGARIVSLSVGAGLSIINANAALNWVLENHTAPCGEDAPEGVCPPIKVVNNSYGPAGGSDFNPGSATAKLQREFAAEGVVTVWANGNAGGDGSDNRSNPAGQDPTPGILSVASYFDHDTGRRDGTVSGYSSRGDADWAQTWPDISAPGQRITSACRPYLWICSTGADARNGPAAADVGTFNTISGTSMAAPHIAGIVAQLFQAAPEATPAEIEHALKSTAHRYADGAGYLRVGPYTRSYDKGSGLVDVVAAVEELSGSVSWNDSVDATPTCVVSATIRVGPYTHGSCV